jgi:hypothetical protein
MSFRMVGMQCWDYDQLDYKDDFEFVPTMFKRDIQREIHTISEIGHSRPKVHSDALEEQQNPRDIKYTKEFLSNTRV